MKIKDTHLPAASVQALMSSRNLHNAVARAYARCKQAREERPLVSSPRLDGMPRSSFKTSVIEKRYISLEKYEERIAEKEKALQQAQEEAKRVIYGLPDALQDFCFWYYIEGMSMPDVAAWIDRDISTCWRYKKVIEQETA